MIEEKNSLLAYLLCAPEEKIFCREMDTKRNIQEYTFGDLILSTTNLGRYLDSKEEWGEHIPIFLDTSYDFLRTFLGIVAAKKVCVPVHTIANEESMEFILKKVRSKCLVVTQKRLYQKLTKLNYVYQHIHTIFTTKEIIEEKNLPCRHIDIAEIFSQSKDLESAKSFLTNVVENTHKDDVMQIVFTSGTTGEPKGAILSHKNVISCVVRAGNHLKINSSYRTLTFLPLSHVMAQNEVFIALTVQATVQITGRDNLLHALKTFAPNILVSVPRVYEAIYQGIQKKLKNKPFARKLIDFTVKMHKLSKKASPLVRLGAFLFSKTFGHIITAKIRKNIGKFNLMVTAGAACPAHIYEFYEAISMPLTNAQGLTEVSGAIIYNQANETLNGSIGFPLPGVEVKVDEDGEILLKGDPVFSGYFEEPEWNRNSFTSDGFFRTGDLGEIQFLRNKPYVFLKGRKKEILVLSSGLNIPAVQIEERLVRHEIILQAMVVGDGQPKLAALIVPNAECCKNGDLRGEISKVIRQVNSQMDASEHIGEFEILSEPFTIENGMLTPTLKIRRPAVFQRYKEIIGHFYEASVC
ncbi:MAG: AMP-binding protein [Candidatus Brocadiae bacterium]|nr:AMP-binding protein [Candidatus Brocadiia bacterium]